MDIIIVILLAQFACLFIVVDAHCTFYTSCALISFFFYFTFLLASPLHFLLLFSFVYLMTRFLMVQFYLSISLCLNTLLGGTSFGTCCSDFTAGGSGAVSLIISWCTTVVVDNLMIPCYVRGPQDIALPHCVCLALPCCWSTGFFFIFLSAVVARLLHARQWVCAVSLSTDCNFHSTVLRLLFNTLEVADCS